MIFQLIKIIAKIILSSIDELLEINKNEHKKLIELNDVKNNNLEDYKIITINKINYNNIL